MVEHNSQMTLLKNGNYDSSCLISILNLKRGKTEHTYQNIDALKFFIICDILSIIAEYSHFKRVYKKC